MELALVELSQDLMVAGLIWMDPDPEGQPDGMIIPAGQCCVVYFC